MDKSIIMTPLLLRLYGLGIRMHSSNTDTSMNNILIKEIEVYGFESTLIDISPVDKVKVQNSIIERWGTIEAFNARVLDTVGGALKLSQVSSTLNL